MAIDRLASAMERIRTSRMLTSSFLQDIAADQWFWQPPGLSTHVAWQVGHSAAAQYALCLKRTRGGVESDAQLIPAEFAASFGRGSEPASAGESPSVEQIQSVFDRVHEQTLAELSQRTAEELDVATEPTHPMFSTKLEAVEFSSQHELLHAGQIALLRRLMGKRPLR